jgi:small basic protein (TIGR04137 family)
MSLDRSLKAANALIRHRNVLTRTERLEKLTEEEKWSEGKSVFGLPKVAHRKMTLAKEVKEEVAADGTTPAAPGAAPAAGAAPGAPAAGGKAPAAKGAAPAAAAAKAPATPAAKKK